MPVSIDDVARRAGVSPGTVSHVLNGNVRARIALATQERVRKAATELGYYPNRIARSLGRRRTDTIGLIMTGLQNQFYVQLLESVEKQAIAAGYQVLLDAVPLYMGDSRRAKLRGWPVDGLIMWAQPQQTIIDYLESAADKPVVYLGGQPRPDNRDSVIFDVYGGAREAMRHLISKGHRKIAYLFPYDWVLQQEDEPRRAAYSDACRDAGIEPQLVLMERHEETRRAGYESGEAIAAMPAEYRPTAVLCFNDMVAQGVLFGVRRAGLRVPEDIAVIGFDGLEESRYLDIPLTTVELSADEMSRHALAILLRRIKEGHEVAPQRAVVPTRLALGDTA